VESSAEIVVAVVAFIQHKLLVMRLKLATNLLHPRFHCLPTSRAQPHAYASPTNVHIGIGRSSLRFLRCVMNGLSRTKLNELFTIDDNIRKTRGHSWKLAKFRCLHGTAVKYFCLVEKLLIDGISWISGQLMLLASMRSSSV